MAIPFSRPVYNRRVRPLPPVTSIHRQVCYSNIFHVFFYKTYLFLCCSSRNYFFECKITVFFYFQVGYEDLNPSSRNFLILLVEIQRILLAINSENAPGAVESSVVSVEEEEERVVYEETAVNVKCESVSGLMSQDSSVNSDVLHSLNSYPVDVKLNPLPDLVPLREQELNTYRVDESSQIKINLPDLVPRTDLVDLSDSSNPKTQSPCQGVVSFPDIVMCSVPSRSKSNLTLSEFLKPRVERQITNSRIEAKHETIELEAPGTQLQQSWKETGRSLKQIADGFTFGANSSSSFNPAAQVGRFLRQVVRTSSLEQVSLDQRTEDEPDSRSESSTSLNMFGDLSVSLLFKFALYLALKKLHNVL